MSRRHKHIFLPLSEMTGALRTAIAARLKNYGQNPNALFKQDTVQTIVTYTRKSDGAKFAFLSFLSKPAFLPARFREIATGFDKVHSHQEMLNFINSDIFEKPERLTILAKAQILNLIDEAEKAEPK